MAHARHRENKSWKGRSGAAAGKHAVDGEAVRVNVYRNDKGWTELLRTL